MPAPDRKIPAYVSRPRLIEELDICDRTLDNWIARGFPRACRNNKWKWETVQRYMDGDDGCGVASSGDTDLIERVRHASREHFRKAH